MKILHITTDNKFISHALKSFENVYPGENEIWMLTRSGEINSSNNDFLKFSFIQTLNPFFSSKLRNYDLVVLHSLIAYWIPIIIFSSKKVKFAWLGWGFDYYDYIYKSQDLLLMEKSKGLNKRCVKIKSKDSIHRSLKIISRWLYYLVFKPIALKKIGSFSPVLNEDYELVTKAKRLSDFPPYIAWNYGSLEESLVKDFIGIRVTGNSILVGNSASFTNNHTEIFHMLSEFDILEDNNRSIIVPLSYGDECCKEIILKEGRMILGGGFEPLENFMSIESYVKRICDCGFVIMNHIRQQAVGNIVIMLYLGARVFLREESPVYQFLKKEGVILNTVQELRRNPFLLEEKLANSDIEYNIDILKKHWSKKAIDQKTSGLVRFHINN